MKYQKWFTQPYLEFHRYRNRYDDILVLGNFVFTTNESQTCIHILSIDIIPILFECQANAEVWPALFGQRLTVKDTIKSVKLITSYAISWNFYSSNVNFRTIITLRNEHNRDCINALQLNIILQQISIYICVSLPCSKHISFKAQQSQCILIHRSDISFNFVSFTSFFVRSVAACIYFMNSLHCIHK